MSTHTTNLNLVKPGATDPVNVSDINGNMDIIDGAVQGLRESVSQYGNAVTVAGSWQATIDVMEQSFQAASNYSAFQGSTNSGVEGAWWGFRHNPARDLSGQAIVISRGNLLFATRVNGSWKMHIVMV